MQAAAVEMRGETSIQISLNYHCIRIFFIYTISATKEGGQLTEKIISI